MPRVAAGVRGVVARSPRELLRLVGRVVVWAVIVLLLVRGAADVLADGTRPDERAGRAAQPVEVWPDERARVFAAGFARAYLSYSPRRRAQYLRGISRFMAPELVAGAVPQFADRSGEQLVIEAAAARTSTIGV